MNANIPRNLEFQPLTIQPLFFPDEAELLDDWNVDRIILIWLGFSPSDVAAAWFSWNRLHLGAEPDCLARPKSSEYSFVRAAI